MNDMDAMDVFAAFAMSGILSNPSTMKEMNSWSPHDALEVENSVARGAYWQAAAMMRARAQKAQIIIDSADEPPLGPGASSTPEAGASGVPVE